MNPDYETDDAEAEHLLPGKKEPSEEADKTKQEGSQGESNAQGCEEPERWYGF